MYIVLPAIIIWALALAAPIGAFGHQASLQTTGLEAMLWDNINMFIFIGILCFTAIGSYVTTQ